MTDPTSFGSISPAIGGHVFATKYRTLSLEEARATPSFAKPVTLFDKWQALPGTIPHHKNITPAFVGAQISSEIYILDVLPQKINDVDSCWDFRWRLFGTAHSDRYGKDATGILLSEAAIGDESAAGSYNIAKQVMKTHEAVFFLTKFIQNEVVHKTTSTVVMPLLDDGGNVSRLFGCSAWSKL